MKRKRSKTTLPVILSLLLIVMIMLAACAGDETGEAQPVELVPAEEEAVVEPAAQEAAPEVEVEAATQEVVPEAEIEPEEEAVDTAEIAETPEITATTEVTEDSQAEQQQSSEAATTETSLPSEAALRASELLDYQVQNSNGEMIGELEDLMVGMENGQLHYAMLSFGGFLEMGDRLFAVPVSALNLDQAQGVMVADLTEETLQSAPSFDLESWPDTAASDWDAELRDFWQSQGVEMSETADDSVAERVEGKTIIRASEMLGYNVVNANLEGIGEIDDLMIGLDSNQVRYAVLGFGGFLDLGEKLFAVPLSAIEFDPSRGYMIFDVEEETLANAPGFDPAQWPDTADPRWDVDSSAYWQQAGFDQAAPLTPGLTNTIVNEPATRLSELVEASMVTPEGESIGQVADLIMGYPSGQIGYAALSFEGVESLEDKLYVVPFSALIPNSETGQVVFDVVDLDTLAEAPGFEPDNWPEMANIGWDDEFIAYWSSTAILQEPALRASELVGYQVTNPQEESDVGTVEDLLIGLTSREVNYVLLNAQTAQSEPILFPFHLLSLDPATGEAFTYVDSETLENAPTMAEDIPDLSNPEWDNPLLAYWGDGVASPVPALATGPMIGSDGARVSMLLGYDVENRAGEEIGEVEEILIDPETEQALYTVVSTGGFLGLGEKLFPLPLNQLEIDPVQEALIVDASAENFQDAPSFELDSWPEATDPQWRAYWDDVWGQPASAEMAPNALEGAAARASELLDYEVQNAEGATWGEIEELVVSLNDGRVKYAIVEIEDGLLEPGEALLGIPLSAMSVDQANDVAVLDVNQQALQEAPHLDLDSGPNVANAEWEAAVSDYWNNNSDVN